ncbi:MAG: molybdopterin converting factor subunit 1 [Pirellulaceae bacterium]|nr:molybdopterin converting factor subunit 1 [Pirellulaceae bacterium]
MKINVIVFAAVKEVLGRERLEIDLHAPATVADLRQALLQKYPNITDLMDHCVISVDQEYSDDSTVLKEGCEVGVIPPVSGG